MTNAKDYVKARQEHITPKEVPSLEELKTLLEDIIDNGEGVFIDKGYIPLTTAVAGKIYNLCASKGGYELFDEDLRDWLAEYNWSISANLRENSHLVLVFLPK